MREAYTPKNVVNHEMSTRNRGSLLAQERGSRGMPPGNAGLPGRNASQHPSDIQFGPNGRIGGNDPDDANDLDADFDAGPWDA